MVFFSAVGIARSWEESCELSSPQPCRGAWHTCALQEFTIRTTTSTDQLHTVLAEHMRKQSFVHSDILKDKLDEVRSRARFELWRARPI